MKHDRTEQLLASNAFDNQMNQSSNKKQYSRLTSGKKVRAKRSSIVTKSTRLESPKKLNPNESVNNVASTAQIGSRQKSPSPNRLSPDVSRALARELYIESTVNVVNAGGRKSPSKVKPGQMNLFNPQGLKKKEMDNS